MRGGGVKRKRCYRAEVEIDWKVDGEPVVVRAGETSDAIPAAAISWLLACGAILEVRDGDR
jgi:hypothetical protein